MLTNNGGVNLNLKDINGINIIKNIVNIEIRKLSETAFISDIQNKLVHLKKNKNLHVNNRQVQQEDNLN